MSSAKRLAQEILDTRRLALGHATSPQLTSSAIDGGGIDFRDAEGNPIAGIGVGDDGGFIIDYTGGPKPPKPSPPTVTADAGIFRVEWDGSFVNEGDEGILATSDTDRVEIHASMDENFVPDRVESFGGAFATLDGGSFTLGPLPEAGTYYFRLVARSKSAQFSEPSDRVEQVLAITSIDLEITDAWLTGEAAQNTADGKNSIWRGPDEPEADPDRPFKDGDIWFEMVDGKSIPNIWDETAGAWVANDDYRQSEIERVQQELRDELDTIIVDGSGTKNFYTPDMPTEGMSEGDLWFDSSDKNKPYIYQDGEWITVRDQFVKPSTSLNVTDWGMLQPNMKAIEGQWSSTDYRVELETSDDLGGQSLGVVNIPEGETGGGFITLPFQGVLSGSSSPDYSDDLFVNEGRPISIDLQLLYNGPFQPSASQRTLTAHYFADGELVDSRTIDYATLSREVFPAAPDFNNPVAFYANLLGYQFGMRVTGTVSPTTVASADEIALTVEIPLPAGSGVEKKLAVWSIDSRVQVPSTGLADGAVTETKVSDDAISTPKLQAGAIVAGKIAANAIETDHLDSKIVTTDKIATGAITAESGIIGSINAGTITVGEMNGARIKAGTIAASSIAVGDFSNLATVDPIRNVQVTRPANWSTETSGDYITPKATSQNYLMFKDRTNTVPFKAGDTLRVTFKGVSAAPGNVLIRLWGYPELEDGSTSGVVGASGDLLSVTTTEQQFSGTVTIPSSFGASTILKSWIIGLGPSGSTDMHGVKVRDVRVYRMNSGEMIVNGAISTEHIRAGAITAESGIIGSLDANVITSGKIMGNQLDADAINGKTITGATIRTASSGSRVELTHNGLKQYNSLGQVIADLTQGQLSIAGDFHSGVDGGARVSIVDSMWDDIMAPGAGGMDAPGVSYTGAGAGLRVGVDGSEGLSIYHLPYGSGESSAVIESPGGLSGINMHSSGFTVMGGLDSEKIKGNGRVFTFKGGSSGGAAVMQSFNLSGNLRTTIGANSTPGLVWMQALDSSGYEAAGAQFKSDGSATFTAGSQGVVRGDTIIVRGDYGVDIMGVAGNVTLTGQRVQSSAIYKTTGVTSASVYINASTGSLGRNTSSARYKQDIKEAEPLDGLLDVETRRWRDRNSVAQYTEAQAYLDEIGEGPLPRELSETPDEPGFEFGAIAEEVDDLGLTDLVLYDAFGRPDSLHYEKFGVALIPIVRSLRDRIEALEAQLASA